MHIQVKHPRSMAFILILGAFIGGSIFALGPMAEEAFSSANVLVPLVIGVIAAINTLNQVAGATGRLVKKGILVKCVEILSIKIN